MNELPLLQTFLAVYRLQSVTRAADHLAITQPGASGHLRALEERLGKSLFVKHGRGLRPTSAADDLARSIGPHLDAIEASLLSAKMSRNRFPGLVQLGGPAEFLSEMIGPHLAPVLTAGARVRMRFGLSQTLIDALAAGTLDLAVSTLRIRSPSVEYAPLYRERFVLIGSTELARRLDGQAATPARLADLGDPAIVSYASDLPIIRRFWRDVFGSEIVVEPALIAPDLRAVIAAVAAGLGVSVAPDYLCGAAVANGRVAILNDGCGRSFNQLQLGWNRYAINHPRVAFLRDQIIAAFDSKSCKESEGA